MKEQLGPSRPWERPALVTLVRGTPEEAVLGACKHAAHSESFPNSDHHQCAGFLDFPCVLCTILGTS